MLNYDPPYRAVLLRSAAPLENVRASFKITPRLLYPWKVLSSLLFCELEKKIPTLPTAQGMLHEDSATKETVQRALAVLSQNKDLVLPESALRRLENELKGLMDHDVRHISYLLRHREIYRNQHREIVNQLNEINAITSPNQAG